MLAKIEGNENVHAELVGIGAIILGSNLTVSGRAGIAKQSQFLGSILEKLHMKGQTEPNGGKE